MIIVDITIKLIGKVNIEYMILFYLLKEKGYIKLFLKLNLGWSCK